MKKLILVLAILVVAAPAFALDINLVRQGTTNLVDVRYTGADPCNLPRGFALVIDVNSKAVITAVAGYKTGESTSTNRGFGIYPATIAIEANGAVTGWGTPIASDSDPLPAGADQVLPSQKIVLEFGSLYAPVHDGTNSPAVDGNLATLTVDCNGSAGSINVRMIGETTYRGGVVLENGTTFAVSKSLAITCGNDCFPSGYTTYASWVTLGKPSCWCAPPNGSGYQCKGDADGLTQNPPSNYRVYSNDLAKITANWKKKTSDTTLNPCADIDHKTQNPPSNYRVYSNDLGIVVTNWKKKDSAIGVPAPCPVAE